jgi:formate dehydrogenase subunit gamma
VRHHDRGPSSSPERPPSGRDGTVRAIARRHVGERGPLLPVLHEVVEALGHVDDTDVPVVAEVLNLSRADVHGVVSFYADFRRTPAPAHRVTVCRGEACQAVGAEAVHQAALAAARQAPALASAGTAAAPSARDTAPAAPAGVEVAEVFCLGNCALGPSGTVDGALRGRLTPEGVAATVEALA